MEQIPGQPGVGTCGPCRKAQDPCELVDGVLDPASAPAETDTVSVVSARVEIGAACERSDEWTWR